MITLSTTVAEMEDIERKPHSNHLIELFCLTLCRFLVAFFLKNTLQGHPRYIDHSLISSDAFPFELCLVEAGTKEDNIITQFFC
ncbi:unnamed protein product [Caenorhabditis brenneri]